MLILTVQMNSNFSDISEAYKTAIEFARKHYENFPVISLLIPANLRKHIAIIYWFARTADDFADEGEYEKSYRLTKLDEMEGLLSDSNKISYDSPFHTALQNTIKEKNLTKQLFHDLITAFKQDVIKNRYETFDDVLGYCKYSANPVGRLILELFEVRNEEVFKYSDRICTALQLTNFYQDLEIDYEKGRIYLPQNEMVKFGVSENIFAKKENNVNLKMLLKYNVDRTQKLFNEGKSLLKFLNGRLKMEIKWTILGGEKILEKIRKNDYSIFGLRPKLTKKDFGTLLIKSFVR